MRHRTRIKSQVHAILARHLAPTPPVSDLFGVAGRHWLSRQDLPADERAAVKALPRQLDFHGGELAAADRELAAEALSDHVVARLVTIPGVDALTAISIVMSAHSPRRLWRRRSGTSPGSAALASSSPTWA